METRLITLNAKFTYFQLIRTLWLTNIDQLSKDDGQCLIMNINVFFYLQSNTKRVDRTDNPPCKEILKNVRPLITLKAKFSFGQLLRTLWLTNINHLSKDDGQCLIMNTNVFFYLQSISQIRSYLHVASLTIKLVINLPKDNWTN